MTNRKLQALRNLAERPGTEAEGQVAREMLAKLGVASRADQQPKYGILDVERDPLFDQVLADVLRRAEMSLQKAMYDLERGSESFRAFGAATERAGRNFNGFQREATKAK